MEGKLFIKSNSVVMQNNKVLVDSGGKLLGGFVLEDENLEEACVRGAREKEVDVEIVKPLHSKIKWGEDGKGEKVILVDVNFLSKLRRENE